MRSRSQHRSVRGWSASGTTVRQRLVLLVLVVAIPVVAVVVYTTQASRTTARESADRTTRQMASLAASSIEAFVSDLEAEMRVVAERPAVRDADGARCDPFLAEFHGLHRELANVGVVDLSGTVICSVVAAPPGGLPSVADAEWFQEVARTGRFTVGEPYLGPITGRLVALLALPLESEGQRTGYLAVPVDLVRLGAPFEGLAEATDGVVSVITPEGQIVARSAEPDRYVGEYLDARQLEERRDPTGEATGVDGVRRTYALVPIGGTSWSSFAGVPLDTAYGDTDRLGTTLLVVTGAAMGLGLIAAAVIGTSITRPVRSLARRADIAARTDSSPTRIERGPREVTDAAASIDAMIRARIATADERIALLERVIASEDTERTQVARDLHDSTVQEVAALANHAEALRRGLTAGRVGPDELAGRIDELAHAARAAVETARATLFDFAAPDTSEGLQSAIATLAQRSFDGATTAVSVQGELPQLDHHQANHAHRIVAEALRNTRQHAEASAVAIRLGVEDDHAVITITDDGIGVGDDGPRSEPGHLGVRAMHERAIILGGTCTIRSQPEGGTQVSLRFPIVAATAP